MLPRHSRICYPKVVSVTTLLMRCRKIKAIMQIPPYCRRMAVITGTLYGAETVNIVLVNLNIICSSPKHYVCIFSPTRLIN